MGWPGPGRVRCAVRLGGVVVGHLERHVRDRVRLFGLLSR